MDVVVIGGGIVGASIAYHLSETSDASVVVCEQHDEPVAETTRWSIASFKMLDHAAHRSMREEALRTYNAFMAEPRADPWYDVVGQLVVATTDEYARALREAGEADAESVLSDAVYLDGDDLAATMVVPELDTDAVVGGLYRPHVGYFESEELAMEFVVRARENGVAFETGTRVESVRLDDGRATGVDTDSGTIDADEVVCAAGPWNASIADQVGLDLPLRHTVASALEVRTPSDAVHVTPKINHRETGSGFRGSGGETDLVYRTGPTGNPGEYYDRGEQRDPDDLDVRPDAIADDLLSTMTALLPVLADATVVDQEVGLLSRTPDGLPIVGRTGVPGFSIAALHAEGIQLAPAIGRTVAAELTDGEAPSYAEALSPDRFADGVEVASGHGGWG